MINWFGTTSPNTNIVQTAISDVFSGDVTASATNTVVRMAGSTNGFVIVSIAYQGDPVPAVITNVAFSGTNCTYIGAAADANDVKVEMWGLVIGSMAAGTNQTIIKWDTTIALGSSCTLATTVFGNVNQATPYGTFSSANGAGLPIDSPSINVASATNELVFDTVSHYSGAAISPGPGQGVVWAGLQPPVGICASASTKQGSAGTTTMTWPTFPMANTWAQAAVSLKP